MYVFTHALLGGALGVAVKNSRHCLVMGTVGGILPDVPMGVQIVYTVVSGMNPWDIKWWKPTVVVSDAFHSLPICLILLVAGWGKPSIRSLALGMVSHSVADVLTHTITSEFTATYLWPLPWQLGKLLGVWEYRRGPGRLLPKWPEFLVEAASITAIAYSLLKRKQVQET